MAGRRRHHRKPAPTIPTTRISVIVIDDQHRILLVCHRKGPKSYWVLPGGRLEYGETFVECAVRELKEETGLVVEFEKFLYFSEAIAPDRSRHIVNIYVKCKVVGGVLQLGNEPVLAAVEFIPLANLDEVTVFPPISPMVKKSLSTNFAGSIEYLGNLWA